MANLRAMAERHLGVTLEGSFGADVRLIPPDGEEFAARGQVLYNTVRIDPTTAERMLFNTEIVTLRRSSLRRVPLAGENWLVWIPESPLPDAPMVQRALNTSRPPEGGAAIGFIRLYLQEVEQLEPEA